MLITMFAIGAIRCLSQTVFFRLLLLLNTKLGILYNTILLVFLHKLKGHSISLQIVAFVYERKSSFSITIHIQLSD